MGINPDLVAGDLAGPAADMLGLRGSQSTLILRPGTLARPPETLVNSSLS
jgi:hypothetical protein